jgi:hypothetical protein
MTLYVRYVRRKVAQKALVRNMRPGIKPTTGAALVGLGKGVAAVADSLLVGYD